jgi:polyhydroxybutyrate depolymerase
MLPPGDHWLTVPAGGRERRALVHVPAGHDASRPAPVVLFFHGAGATVEWTLAETGWGTTADREGFLAVIPEGTPPHTDRPPSFRHNPPLWSYRAGAGVDDVGFATAVLDELERRFLVDLDRVHAAGFSSGAAMTFLLATRLADRLASVAPVAGYCTAPEPRPVHPVPTLYLVGDADPLAPLEGGPIVSPWGGHTEVRPPLRTVFEKWARAIGCPTEPHLVRDEGGVRVTAYGPGEGGGVLVVEVVAGLGHHWPGGKGGLSRRIAGEPSDRVNANDVIWDFFRRHPLNAEGERGA